MTAEKEIRSWDILRDPNRILLEEDYGSKMELLIYTLTWAVETRALFRPRHRLSPGLSG